jgi:tetratricopeptide (TPR) repeat protein
LRSANTGWAGPFVAKGAAATMGNVYEPYLQLTAHLDLFNDRLLHGLTLAESAYASLPALSWMSVVVGDPLYRPFASWLQLDAPRDSSKGAANWRIYHEFAAKYFPNSSSQYRSLARQAASRARNCPMLEDLGLMEAADGNFSGATGYFQQARACYSARDDILRVALEEGEAWAKQNKPKRALDLLRSVLKIASDAPSAPLLRKLEQNVSSQPPPKKP